MNVPAPANARRAAYAAAAALAFALLAAGGWYGYRAIASHPVQRVVFEGSTARVPAGDLEALAQSIRGREGPLPLAEVREAARRLPWVRDAGARRRSLDTVEIHLETHEPLARWNDDSLVSVRGELFRADHDAELPRFRGQDAAAPLMARQYPTLARALAPLASPVAEVRLSPRGAWQVRLASGLVLQLGRGDHEPRIARFVAAWPQLAARGVVAAHADLRYPNGFAMSKQPPQGADGRPRT